MRTKVAPLTAAEVFGADLSLTDTAKREFACVTEGCFRMAPPELGITLEVDRLHRKSDELSGELTVLCSIAGSRTYNGVLSAGTFNLSSIVARERHANYLRERSKASDIDWRLLLEEFCQRVIAADRVGQPAVSLRDVPRASTDDAFVIEGVHLSGRHPVILFGDGGSAKSYLALYLAGRLAQLGLRPALFDWELSGEDHRID